MSVNRTIGPLVYFLNVISENCIGQFTTIFCDVWSDLHILFFFETRDVLDIFPA